jgi:hypothetical protein
MAVAPSSTRVQPSPPELSPGVRDLLECFIPHGARCLAVGQGDRAMRSWLLGHGCRPVEVPTSQATKLPIEDQLFDAALLISVLDQLVSPDLAVTELHRVLRPGGVLLEGQDGAFLRELPLAGRVCHRRGSRPYRLAERFFPSLLGSTVGADAIRA